MPEAQKDEKVFNDTLKRMLKTPPKPHEKNSKETSVANARKVQDRKDVRESDAG